MRRRTRVVVIARPAGPWRSPWVVIARPAGRGDPLRLSLRGAKPRGNLLEQGDRFAALAMTRRGGYRFGPSGLAMTIVVARTRRAGAAPSHPDSRPPSRAPSTPRRSPAGTPARGSPPGAHASSSPRAWGRARRVQFQTRLRRETRETVPPASPGAPRPPRPAHQARGRPLPGCPGRRDPRDAPPWPQPAPGKPAGCARRLPHTPAGESSATLPAARGALAA